MGVSSVSCGCDIDFVEMDFLLAGGGGKE